MAQGPAPSGPLGRPYTPPCPRWEGSVRKLGLLVQVPKLAISFLHPQRLGLIGLRRFLFLKACPSTMQR